MELYIEKEFLDNFYLDYDEQKPSKGQRVLSTIFKEYGDKTTFMDYAVSNPEELNKMKENPFFADLAIHFPPIEITDIKEHFFKKSNCLQTLIFTQTTQEWFPKAEEKGALCMSFNNFENRIAKITTACHYKIDLSEKYGGWEIFKFFLHLPINFITINDNYLLSDRNKMDANVIALLKQVLQNRKNEIFIKLLTKEFKPPQPGTPEQINHEAFQRHKKLNSGLANYKKKIQIIYNGLPHDYNFHDRVILSNFLMIDSGHGFNLLPYRSSNSQIIIESIFEKYTYKRLKNHLKMIDSYCQHLSNPANTSAYFKILPS